jgi:hypothetical protein
LVNKEERLNLQEIVKKIDDIRASIDNAFETGKLDFDKISGDLAKIGDDLAVSLKLSEGSETGKLENTLKSPAAARDFKFEDYI